MGGKGTAIPALARMRVKGRDFMRCVRCGMPALAGEWHHRRSRSVVDDCQHATCNGIWLCLLCHEWVHGHPFEARAQGFIVSRYAVPCEVPINSVQHGRVLLDHEGGVAPASEEEGDGAGTA